MKAKTQQDEDTGARRVLRGSQAGEFIETRRRELPTTNGSHQCGPRLCRLMCGRAAPFREVKK